LAIYSRSFFRGTHSGGQAVVYTPPAGDTTVIRQITAFNFSTTADAVEVAIGVPGSAVPIWHVNNVSSTNGSIEFQGRVVLELGDLIYVATGAEPWYITISGYDLTS
jgi:hypothetical protein